MDQSVGAGHGLDVQLWNFKDHGVLSARLDMRNSPDIANDKFAEVQSSQAAYTKIEPRVPEWPKTGDATIRAVREGPELPEDTGADPEGPLHRRQSGARRQIASVDSERARGIIIPPSSLSPSGALDACRARCRRAMM